MGQTAVTKERLEAMTRKLADAARRGELGSTDDREPVTPELTGTSPQMQVEGLAGGGGILQLAITPETLLRMAGSGAKELVITINER